MIRWVRRLRALAFSSHDALFARPELLHPALDVGHLLLDAPGHRFLPAFRRLSIRTLDPTAARHGARRLHTKPKPGRTEPVWTSSREGEAFINAERAAPADFRAHDGHGRETPTGKASSQAAAACEEQPRGSALPQSQETPRKSIP